MMKAFMIVEWHTFGNNSKFHSNLDFDDSLLHSLLIFYRIILQPWKKLVTFLTVDNFTSCHSIKISQLVKSLFP